MLWHLPRRSRPAGRVVVVVTAVLAVLALAPAAGADPASGEPETPEHAYRAEGQEVAGGGSIAQAPTIAPGIHRDSFALGAVDSETSPREGTVKHYRMTVADGQRVHAAATIAAPPYDDGVPEEPGTLDVAVSFVTAGGEECLGSGVDGTPMSENGIGPVTASAVSAVVGPDGCAGDELFVRVQRQGTRAADASLPMEIQVALRPVGIGGGGPAVEEEIEDQGASPVAPEDTDPIDLGRSFAAATPLEPGSHVVELVPGATGLVSVQVAEGQRLRWRTEVVSAPQEDPGSIGLQTYDAARSLVTVGGGTRDLDRGDAIAGGGMAAPVDLGNRGSDLDAVATAWLPGTYTVMLQRPQRPEGTDPAGAEPVRLILTLEVQGEPAADAAEGTVLELGETTADGDRGGPFALEGNLGRVAMLVGAGLLTLMAAVTGVAGVLVLRLRR